MQIRAGKTVQNFNVESAYYSFLTFVTVVPESSEQYRSYDMRTTPAGSYGYSSTLVNYVQKRLRDYPESLLYIIYFSSTNFQHLHSSPEHSACNFIREPLILHIRFHWQPDCYYCLNGRFHLRLSGNGETADAFCRIIRAEGPVEIALFSNNMRKVANAIINTSPYLKQSSYQGHFRIINCIVRKCISA